MADKTRIETFHRFTYGINGSVSEMQTNEHMFAFTYDDGHVVREDSLR